MANFKELLEESLFSQFIAVKQNVSWHFQSSVTMGGLGYSDYRLQKNMLIWVKESGALNLLILFATGKSFDDVGPVLMEYDGRGETVAMVLTIHQTPSSYNIKRIFLKYAGKKWR